MAERIRRIRKDITELNEYVKENKEIIKELKEQYERAVNINECLIGRIRAMEKEIVDLERGQYGLQNLVFCEYTTNIKALDSKYAKLYDEEVL